MIDFSQFFKGKYLDFERSILKLKRYLAPEKYYLKLCDHAIECDILTVKEFRLLTKRFKPRGMKFLIQMMEQIIFNRMKAKKMADYWSGKNYITNLDKTMDKALNAGINKKRT